MARGKVVTCVALLIAVVTSLALIHPSLPDVWMKLPRMGCLSSRGNEAYRADSQLLSRLSNAPSLVHLTEAQEPASELLEKLDSYRALVVVTAGRGGPTRRAPEQPFASFSPQDAPLLRPALAAPLAAMNAAAAALEAVLGRRLFPLTLSLFDRPSSKAPYALFDASSGSLLLDRSLVAATWGPAPAAAATATAGLAAEDDSAEQAQAHGLGPQVSYLTQDLASRVFRNLAALIASATTTTTTVAQGATTFSASAGGDAGAGADLTHGSLDLEGVHAEEQQEEQQSATQRRQLLDADSAHLNDNNNVNNNNNDVFSTLVSTLSSTLCSSGGAAAALALLAAAVGSALPAAFAAAPPLWFCVLCPSVLGLLAPVLINTALNQIAGALCRQMQLSDDACFDVLLGALGAGFVLSLASAVPIFFVCRLPQCAGKNVTAALARVMAGLR